MDKVIASPYHKQYATILLVITAYSFIRCLLDWVLIYKWQHPAVEILANHNMFIYGYTIYLGMAGLGFLAVGVKPYNEALYPQMREFYIKSSWFWVIFPLVTIISVLAGSKYDLTIPIFKYIPGFMVQHNYLPLGMVVVMPIIVIFYQYLFMKVFKWGFIKALIANSAGCWILYLLFYQFGLRAAFFFRDEWHNLYAFMGFYSTLMLVFLRLQTIYFDAAFLIKKQVFNRLIELNIALALIMFIVGLVQHYSK